MNLKLVLNKTSPHAHTKSESDVLSIAGKLVKYVVHLFKRKKLKKKKFCYSQAIQTTNGQFLVSRNFKG
jgi:hypothetical protein